MTDQQPEKPTFIGGGARTKSYTLLWPVAYGGKEYREITLRRVTTRELDTYVRDVQDAPPDVTVPSPFMADVDGNELPLAVQEGLDADDGYHIGQIITDFTPARFRGAQAMSESAPGNSGTGDNSSAELPGSATAT